MKSRLAILGMLVTGMLFSTAGAGLAHLRRRAVRQQRRGRPVRDARPRRRRPPTPACTATPTPDHERRRQPG